MKERTITVDVTVKHTGLREEHAYHAEASVASAFRHRVPGNGHTPSEAAAMAVKDLFFGWDMEGQPGQDCW